MTIRKRLIPLAALVGLVILPGAAKAHDALPRTVTRFTATPLEFETDVPGLVIGAIQDGETAVWSELVRHLRHGHRIPRRRFSADADRLAEQGLHRRQCSPAW